MRSKLIFLSGLVVLLSGCTNSKKTANVKTYFNISGFFSSEATRYEKSKVSVFKKVIQNSKAEEKTVRISDWTAELELFTSSDINKPSWSKSYRVIQQGNRISYLARENKLKTRSISIERDARGKIRRIAILNEVKNFLYSSSEELNYYPDSLYLINKRQNVTVLGDNKFQIIGLIKK